MGLGSFILVKLDGDKRQLLLMLTSQQRDVSYETVLLIFQTTHIVLSVDRLENDRQYVHSSVQFLILPPASLLVKFKIEVKILINCTFGETLGSSLHSHITVFVS